MNAMWTNFVTSVDKALNAAFLAPPFLWLLSLIPIIILLYFLKLRRTPVVISSTLLWMKSLQDITANAPFQRLRRNLLLLLQILVLLLAVLALARPFVKAEGSAGRNLCLLVDRSASMKTNENGRPRMDLAKQEALRIVDEMQRGDKVMLVSFADKADVLCELTDDRPRLRAAIEDIQPTDTQTKVRDAYFVAYSLQLTTRDLHSVIISDGDISDLDEIVPRNFGPVRQVSEQSTEARARFYDLSFVKVGSSVKNAGIVVFSLREPSEGTTGDRQVLVLVHNADTEPLSTTVTLSFEDTTLAVEEVSVEPGQDAELVFRLPEIGEGILKAELDHQDDFPTDNVAWLSLHPAAKIRTLVVAEPTATGTYFLQRVLTPDPRVELSTIAPASYSNSDDYDLTIFYGFAPEQLPAGTLLFINTLPKLEGLGSESAIEGPPILSLDAEHPLLRFNVNPSNVSIRSAMKVVLPDWARPVVSTTSGALIGDISRGAQHMAFIGFDIAESDWPLNLSFPLFFQNVLAWTTRAALSADVSIPAGKPLTLVGEPDVANATITLPDASKEQVALDPMRPVYFSNTNQIGIYTVAYGERKERFAVNLLDKVESSIGPSDKLAIGQGEFEAERGRIRQNRELWRYLLAGALCVIALEWWLFSRRAWM
ncbi:MAG: VWA domain-containing protein [Candidatus Hydrogenedentes bacterium]|nr:VWA domain-containing protein [Candidatus Hydrogenedentota bacterium]